VGFLIKDDYGRVGSLGGVNKYGAINGWEGKNER
jgi:hypothetical protein